MKIQLKLWHLLTVQVLLLSSLVWAADSRITDLTELTSGNVATGDFIPCVDVSDTTDNAAGSSRKCQVGSIHNNDVHSGYQDWNDISNPSAPGSGVLRLWARSVSGRMLPKFMGPSGLDNPMQPALFGNNVILYFPNTGTTNGLNLGTPWSGQGTISHPTPASTNVCTQMKRTRLANVATTTNQVLSESSIISGAHQFWRGNAAGLGGFFFFTRFILELYPATTVRIFAGLQDGTTNILTSDTVAGNVVGLWHDTADGANVLSIVTRNNTTTTKTSISGATVAQGRCYDWYMFAKPNDSTIYYRLDDLTAGTTVVDSSVTTTLPTNTAFMGPVVGMSNGTANTTVTTVGPGINRIYVESDH